MKGFMLILWVEGNCNFMYAELLIKVLPKNGTSLKSRENNHGNFLGLSTSNISTDIREDI